VVVCGVVFVVCCIVLFVSCVCVCDLVLSLLVVCGPSPSIDSPCECEHKNPDSLDARLFPSVVLAVATARGKGSTRQSG